MCLVPSKVKSSNNTFYEFICSVVSVRGRVVRRRETLVRVREHPLARTPVEVIYCSSPSTFVLYASVNFSTAMSATMELGAQRT